MSELHESIWRGIAITALYEGLTLLWMVDPDATTWEQTGERSLLLLLDGLAVPC